MTRHLRLNGFVSNYTVWTHHGEHERARAEVLRQRTNDIEGPRVGDMIDDYHDAQLPEDEEPKEIAKAYLHMLESANKPLHEHTKMSQLDAISRVMALKSQVGFPRDCFDALVTVIGEMFPEGHVLPPNMYESKKIITALKMPYEQIHACPNQCLLFRKHYADDKYYAKCKSSRYVEVDHGDGQKKQLKIPAKILRYLPFIPRIQRLYMSKESAKQMMWHKHGKRYNKEKLVNPYEGEAKKNYGHQHA